MKPRKLPSYEIVAKKMEYNPRSGKITGTVKPRVGPGGYLFVSFMKTNYLAHRLAWLLHHKECPGLKQIDHINGNRRDNRISNLRLVSAKGNSRNTKKRVDNTSGRTGVNFEKKIKKWRAQICVSRKNKHLGVFENFEDAVKAREVAEKKYCYHQNHGR